MPTRPSPVDPALAAHLSDARLQVHHAAQLLSAVGISYLRHEPDDTHTNLEWLTALGVLASRPIPAPQSFYVGLRVADLALQVLGDRDDMAATLSLNGQTMASAATWLRAQFTYRGADAARFTLDRHYTIPKHLVATGAPFNASNVAAFDQLSRWFDGANEILGVIRDQNDGDEVRCWPHHFDIATLIEVGRGTTIGVGMEPGDAYCDEPYYYANLHPEPPTPPTDVLAGNGTWHSGEWIAAMLPGSRLAAGAGQVEQIKAFIASAIATYRRILAAT